jgi:hypothetical protein
MAVDRSDRTAELAQLAELLAAGVVRLLAPKSSPICSEGGEVSLHIPPDQSGDPIRRMPEGRE